MISHKTNLNSIFLFFVCFVFDLAYKPVFLKSSPNVRSFDGVTAITPNICFIPSDLAKASQQIIFDIDALLLIY